MIHNFYNSTTTKVDILEPDFKLQIESKTFFIGSCFSNNIFNKYHKLYLNSELSPFGNVYNPLSISNLLNKITEKIEYTENECFKIDGLYQNFDFHSTHGQKELSQYISDINKSIEDAYNFIKEADLLVITFGTAYIYEHDNQIVNNCHKLPNKDFNRRILSVDEIEENITSTLNKIKKINPKINFVLTLSPVRHLRDNSSENSLSKSILRVAIDKISRRIPLYYFPAYEIMLDELRDYRWYETNLTHPGEMAIDYIFQKFVGVTASESLKKYLDRAERLSNMFNHKIINPMSDSAKVFIEKRNNVLENMKNEFKSLQKLQSIKSSQYH